MYIWLFSKFKFQYDNTLSSEKLIYNFKRIIFKFQYDNTLSINGSSSPTFLTKFKFQYDNTLSKKEVFSLVKKIKFKFQYDNTLSLTFSFIRTPISNLNSNMIIL